MISYLEAKRIIFEGLFKPFQVTLVALGTQQGFSYPIKPGFLGLLIPGEHCAPSRKSRKLLYMDLGWVVQVDCPLIYIK